MLKLHVQIQMIEYFTVCLTFNSAVSDWLI